MLHLINRPNHIVISEVDRQNMIYTKQNPLNSVANVDNWIIQGWMAGGTYSLQPVFGSPTTKTHP